MTDQPESPVTGQVLLYGRPEPLDPRVHGHLGLRQTDTPYGFAARQHYVPLNVGEFGPAGVNYPIIFAGDTYTPLAIMGIQGEENLFIDANGRYQPGCYVPSYLRRYPFVGAVDNTQKRVVVCIDAESDLITADNPTYPLFDNGEPSEYVKMCMEFCSQYDTDRARTTSFIELIKSLDLFEPKQTTYTPRNLDGTAGQPQLVSEYFAVSETKLGQLDAAKLVELRDNGALSQIFAHLHSLFLWDRLLNESMLRRPATLNA